MPVRLTNPGIHNVRNALAAAWCADILGLPLDECASALKDFLGTARRFEIRGEFHGAIIIDDYAHHPKEISAILGSKRHSIWRPANLGCLAAAYLFENQTVAKDFTLLLVMLIG